MKKLSPRMNAKNANKSGAKRYSLAVISAIESVICVHSRSFAD